MAARKIDYRWLVASLAVIAAGLYLRDNGPALGSLSVRPVKPAVWTSASERASDGTETFWASVVEERSGADSAPPPPLLAVGCGPGHAGIFVNAGMHLTPTDAADPPPTLSTCRIGAGLLIDTPRIRIGAGAATGVEIDAAIRSSDPECAAGNDQVRARWAAMPKLTLVVSRGRQAIPLQMPGHFEELFGSEVPARAEETPGHAALHLMQADAERKRALEAMLKADSVTASHDGTTYTFGMDGAAEALATVLPHCPDRPAYVVESTPDEGMPLTGESIMERVRSGKGPRLLPAPDPFLSPLADPDVAP